MLLERLPHLVFCEQVLSGREDFRFRHRPAVRRDDFPNLVLCLRLQRSGFPRRVKVADLGFGIGQLLPQFGVVEFQRLGKSGTLLLKGGNLLVYFRERHGHLFVFGPVSF